MNRASRAAGGTYPSLYQINTRVWLTESSRRLGRRATLDDISDNALDRLAEYRFDWIWFLGVWQTGIAGARVSRTNAEWRREFEATLTDLKDADIGGSCFAITAYDVPDEFGGNAALARLRDRIKRRGLRLMLDFVPNHTALDHPWIAAHPEYYVTGSEEQLQHQPQNYYRVDKDRSRVDTDNSRRIVAHGRDPYFPGWPDTAQLNYGNSNLQRAMLTELMHVAARCDGVRCDMAMLLLPHVFERTWHIRSDPFWPWSITQVKRLFPQFVFLAEVYWDLEWTLQQEGFDFTYDKRLYDRLRDGQAAPVRAHLNAPIGFQGRLARFLENHDESRAAAIFPPAMHRAAAIITFLTPGMRLLHHGQIEGRTHRVSPHLVRAPIEPMANDARDFYLQLLDVLKCRALRGGEWQLLTTVRAWHDNPSADNILAWTWRIPGERLLIAVNFAPHQSQGFVHLPFVDKRTANYYLKDLMQSASYTRDSADLSARGLYLDMPAWHYHVFNVVEAARVGAVARRSQSLDPSGLAVGPMAP